MRKLLNLTLNKMLVYAGIVLVISIPAYYLLISRLWKYELDEHKIVLTKEAGREDSFLIILVVTGLTMLFMIVLLGGFIFLNKRSSKKLWQPFYNSLTQIKEFQLDSKEPLRFEKTDIAEFSELNQSLQKLITGNIAAFQQQKEFADNASHELQTPLAIVQSKLELFQQNRSLTTEQYSIIEDVLKALSRVNRINKNLLLLTKIGNSQFDEKELINLSVLLEKSLQPFEGIIAQNKAVISKQIAKDIYAEANKTLVEIIFSNLISNAFRHSNADNHILVRLSEKKFEVANSGSAALNQEKIFRRFGTASHRKPGTGLGLSLVKQICKLYGWEVKYFFENNMHIFSIGF